ncbi:hypothetical protein [Actinophytocola oryzae]|uniref:FAR-17a/AIG1-like protein n=1 Tax=Actinophytocola oryzae TaxID=502181 RepID=A0A4R7VHT4_9PSEU|nr:hypothetical protein [Actinophytocola oryzae]TDV48902.1 hypothetical protein CLV71_108263 [Actinophytocola oryzae]
MHNSALPPQRVPAGVLAGVTLWRLAVATCAFTGGRTHEPRSPWLRGATSVLLLLVCVTFLGVIEGGLDDTWSLFEHLVTPLVVLVDLVAVGRSQANVRWWHPLTWVVFPAAYLVYFIAADPGLYGSFLDPDAADFVGVVAAFLAAFLAAVVAAGYVLYAVLKLKTAIAHAASPQTQWQPAQQWPGQPAQWAQPRQLQYPYPQQGRRP